MRKPSSTRASIHRALAFVFAMGLAAAMHLHAADLRIIANSNVAASSASAQDIRGIFLMTKTSLGEGGHIQPVLLTESPTYSNFVQEYLGKVPGTLEAYYRNLVFSGTGLMPKMLRSNADVVAYVAKTKGAIAYVDNDAPVQGVKILTVK